MYMIAYINIDKKSVRYNVHISLQIKSQAEINEL